MSKLGDFVKVQGGYAFKSRELSDDKTGVPVIKIGNITGGSFVDLSNYQSVSFQLFEKTKSFATKDNDILIAMTGANVGKTSRVPVNSDAYLINQRVGRFLLKEDCPYTSDFIYYVVSSKQAYQYFSRVADGAAQPNISGKTIEDLEFPNIDSRCANKIGNILKSLDDKIQLNTQINQTLEQIAQTIFKSWFIDFDPVHAKANALASGQTAEQATQAAMAVISGKNTQELHRLQTVNPEQYQQLWEIAEAFPSGVDEEGVPRGWEMTTFGNVSQCFDKKRIPLSKRQREQRAGSIPYYGATSVMDYVDEAIFDDIYLLIGEDGSVLKEDGTPFIQYIWGKAWVNNHTHVLQGKGSVSTEQLMLFMASTNITAYVTGAVQMKLNQSNMNSIPFVKAMDRVNELFFDLIKDLYAKVRANSDENKYLVKIRDELLPKLLSGEVVV
ncbi:restriction endonuclease subunit S [Moraxella pluranimalium]|uniref:Restriction endonuclease subunit S n=1 Tax=Moraxella pluranimalium TaxID=470453 RepID=A0A1T0CF69_9GAMM|nr:restriction endonuclease subunit S [Moraxella pluranimalium]OOS20943.1 restriction endonuclease subunit S [Moraxella pluranimalium]